MALTAGFAVAPTTATATGTRAAIDVEKYASVDGPDGPWYNASRPEVAVGGDVWMRILVKNTGRTSLFGTIVTDDVHQDLVDAQCGPLPNPLPPAANPSSINSTEGDPADNDVADDIYVCVFGPITAVDGGPHLNRASAQGFSSVGDPHDSDPAGYVGVPEPARPGIDLEKEVSVDGGTTWFDADEPTGPTATSGANDVFFRFTVTNTGDVALSDIELTDTDFEIPVDEVPATLDPGASFQIVLGPFEAQLGQHVNEGWVVAHAPGDGPGGDDACVDDDSSSDDGKDEQDDGSGDDTSSDDGKDEKDDGSSGDNSSDDGKDDDSSGSDDEGDDDSSGSDDDSSGSGDDDSSDGDDCDDPKPVKVEDHDPAHYIGEREPAMLGDFVWLDDGNGDLANAGNGIQDPGELPVEGVRVELLLGGQVVDVTVTDAQGSYKFNDLTPGVDYAVRFEQPAGTIFTHADQGDDDAVDSDASVFDGETPSVVLAPGEFDDTLDAGLFKCPVRATDNQILVDMTGTRLLDTGPVMTPFFDVDVPAGAYRVTLASADFGPNHTAQNQQFEQFFIRLYSATSDASYESAAISDLADSDALPNWLLELVNDDDDLLVVEEDANRVKAWHIADLIGDQPTANSIDPICVLLEPVAQAQLGDYVWLDADGDGIQDAGETGVNGVTVELLDADMDVIGSTVTADDPATGDPGWYLFDDLQAGTYFVRFVAPDGFGFTVEDAGGDDGVDSDAQPSGPDVGKTAAIDLAEGESDLTWDAGLVNPGVEIVKCVRSDDPIAILQLSGADCSPEYGADANDPNGTDLPVIAPGATVTWTYLVENTGSQLFPGGAVVVTDDVIGTIAGPGAGDDGDGLFEPGEVWIYQATGAALDLGDPANADATVLGCANVPAIGDPERATYKNVGTVTVPGGTDEDPAHYCNPAPSIDIEKVTNGNDADDPNGGDVPVITPGDPVTWTYLVTNTGTVSIPLADVTVTDDAPGVTPELDPGSDDGSDGILSPQEVWVYNAIGEAVDLVTPPPGTTVVHGCADNPFIGDPERATYENVGTVTVPGDSDADPSHYCNPAPSIDIEKATNGNDADDPNGADVPVIAPGEAVTWTYLVTNTGTVSIPLADVTVTDDVPGVVPELDAGSDVGADGVLSPGETWTYIATGDAIDVADPPAGTPVVAGCANSPATGSPEREAYENVGTVAVPGGSDSDPSHYCNPLAELGDRVWEDLDADGIQDPDEAGIADIEVQLLDADMNVIDATTTDADGLYLFTDLAAGTYFVRFVNPDVTVWTFSPRDAGADDTVDSDANPTDPDAGKTAAIELATGDSQLQWDAGLYRPASLGDRVWADRDADGIQDPDEPGVADVEVRLLDADMNEIATTTTDADGLYEFTGLTPGTYFVQFVAPDGTSFTTPDQGGDDTVDSDANPTDGKTASITLVSGQNDPTWDAGLLTPDIDIEKATNGNDADDPNGGDVPVLAPGDPVTWTYRVTNTGVVSIPGADVTVTDSVAGVSPVLDPGSDDGSDGVLSPGEIWVYEATGLAEDLAAPPPGTPVVNGCADRPTPGASERATYENVGTVTVPGDHDDDPSHYCNPPRPDIDIEKATNGSDADGASDADVPVLAPGEQAVWTYQVTNTGEQPFLFDDVTVTDSAAGVTPVFDPASDIGSDGVLSPGEVWTYTAAGVAVDLADPPAGTPVVAGCANIPAPGAPERTAYENIGTVTVPGGTDADPSHYCNPLGEIGDRVWEDLDADGIQDPDEPGIADIEVKLLDENMVEIATTTTDADGNYLFTGLEPGTYFVQFVNPDAAVWTFSPQDVGGDDTVDSDANPSGPDTGKTTPIALAAGESQPQWDAGLYRLASLGDRVWLDEGSGVSANDANGIQDAGEQGVEGVEVKLLDANMVEIATTTTDADGFYQFTDLVPGTYFVQFVKPDGTSFTSADQGTDDAVDSDADPTDGKTAAITLVSGQNDPTWDAGLLTPDIDIEKATNGADADGSNDADVPVLAPGDPVTWTYLVTNTGAVSIPLADVTVTDSTPGVTPVLDAGSDVGADGVLSPGEVWTYTAVGVAADLTDPPAGTAVVAGCANSPAAGSPERDTYENVGTVTVPGGSDADLSHYCNPLGEIGDRVWEDLDADGIQDPDEPGIEGIEVQLLDADMNVIDATTTDADGLYLFPDLAAGTYFVRFVNPDTAVWTFSPQNAGGDDTVDSDANPTGPDTGKTAPIALTAGDSQLQWDAGLYRPGSIGDRVWDDLDGDGIQDPNEPGFGGVEVKLLDENMVEIASTTTDADGLYEFAGLAPGTYFVQFVAPDGSSFSPPDQGGDDTVDSDANPIDGKTAPIVLAAGDSQTQWDAGIFQRASIGDRVWEDLDGDGVQDQGEPSVPGVEVKLLDENMVEIASTTTDGNGNYLFTDLPAGTYFVQFVNPDAGIWTFTAPNAGADDTVDSDADPIDGKTAPIVLGMGDVQTQWDAGLVRPASIGDRVWNDLDEDGIQDPDEPGVPGVEVKLLDENMVEIASTTTDADGLYEFTGLTPGTYFVQFVAPDGTSFTSPDQGGDDTVDSDANPADGKTAAITLVSGQSDTTRDAGILVPDIIEIDLQIEKIAEPEAVIAGTDFTYTLRVSNLGPDAATGVVVLDALPARTLSADDALFAPAAGFEQFPFFDENGEAVGDEFWQINVPPAVDPGPFTSDERVATNGVQYNGASASDLNGPRPDITCTRTASAHAVRCEVGDLGPGEEVDIELHVTMDPSAFFRVWNRAWVYGDQTLSGNEPNQVKADVGELCQTTSNTDSPPFNPMALGGPTLMGDGCNYIKKNASVTNEIDLAIVKSSSAPEIDVGGAFSFTFDVVNNGPSTAPTVVVSDELPANLAFVGVTTPVGTCSHDGSATGGTLTCDLGSLLPDAPVTITVDVQMETAPAGSLCATNTADVFDDTGVVMVGDDEITWPDTDATNNSDSAEVCVPPPVVEADLAIVKTASVVQAGAGTGFDFVLEITNNGPDPAENVVIGDIVPSQVTVAGVSSADFDCGNAGNVVTCTRASMAAGATGTVTIAVTVPEDALDGTIENVATVESDTDDPDLTNNSEDESVVLVAQVPPPTVAPPPPVTLPQTGSSGTADLIRSAFLLALVGAGLVVVVRRRGGQVPG
ncbi:MAG: SdrD B-like domain-containing protein [Ilumatobacter sp.]|uniref:SdrD B-like domain-containing protein n=1 Tax=Ilumatobacter sp. TaxID=1967498 RepID=UPI00263578FB|nr:SdrD B-like domain-containing protein [Ilumatobacter sp.]MDJ0767879.1 SdrD B-like domain-containing protein [Ilumatobacter sp.]